MRDLFIFQAWGRYKEADRQSPNVEENIIQRSANLATSAEGLWAAWALLEHRRITMPSARVLFQIAKMAAHKLITGNMSGRTGSRPV